MSAPATFDEAKARLLQHLDRHFQNYREILCDDTHTNDASPAIRAAISGMDTAAKVIFKLKNLKNDITRLSPNP